MSVVREVVETMRVCIACHEGKPLTEFYRADKFGHYKTRCKPCFVAWQLKTREAIRDKVREGNKAACARHREKYPEKRRATALEHAKRYPQQYAAKAAKRRAATLRATPPWADLDAIAAIYARAAEETKQTGIKMDVDHIYPLKSDVVCGLHVPANLRIVPASVNRSKGNRLTEIC